MLPKMLWHSNFNVWNDFIAIDGPKSKFHHIETFNGPPERIEELKVKADEFLAICRAHPHESRLELRARCIAARGSEVQPVVPGPDVFLLSLSLSLSLFS